MPVLTSLAINHLRNLDAVSISLSPTVNIFYGNNGSGKTSLLEAVSFLGMGRSFRSHKARSLINHEKDELIVFSELLADGVVLPLGIQKTRSGDTQIKIAGQLVHSAAELAKQLPLILINSSSFQLIEGSPQQRRQFLDWMVFHVKPEFAALWRAAEKLVKQRNSLLRHDKITPLELDPWDKELARISEEIDSLRAGVFQQFSPIFEKLKDELFADAVADLSVKLEYYRGWDKEQPILDALKQSFERDRRKGYTHIGPQRADIKIQCLQKKASEVLSRGQEKTLISAMMLAQSDLYTEETGKKSVFLIDDLLAELDKNYSQALARKLVTMKNQVLVTGVERDEHQDIWKTAGVEPAVFHVEHGNVYPEAT